MSEDKEGPRPFFLSLAMAEKGVKHYSTKTRHVFGGKATGWRFQYRMETEAIYTEAISAALAPTDNVVSRL